MGHQEGMILRGSCAGGMASSMGRRAKLTIMYAAVQGLYWMCYCPIVGYVSPYLLGLGYESTHIGAVLAVGNIISLIVQPVLSERADADARFSPLRVAAGLMVAIMLSSLAQAAFMPRGAAMLALCTLSAVCVISSCAFVTSIKFQLASDEAIDFGVCRAIGSLSWALVSVPLGFAVEKLGPRVVPLFASAAAAILLVLLSLCGKHVEREGNAVLAPSSGTCEDVRTWGAFARDNGWLMVLLIGISLVYLHHSLANNFSILLVEHVGGDSSDMGIMIALAALCELPAMMLFSRISKRFRIQALVAISIVMFAVKALAIWMASSVGMLMGAFSLQLVSFAVFTPATVAYAPLVTEKRDLVKAQTAFTLVTTLSAVFSAFVGGALFQGFGTAATLGIAAAAAVAGLAVSLVAIARIGMRRPLP